LPYRFIASKACNLGYLLPTLVILQQRLQALRGTVKHVLPLIDSLLNGIEQRFGGLFEDNDLLLAAVTHPRFKLDWIKSPELRDKCKRLLSVAVANNSTSSTDAAASIIPENDNFITLANALLLRLNQICSTLLIEIKTC
jgi:hypothetical protein